VTTFALDFVQKNACGYSETVEIIGLPEFVTYDERQRNFVISTDNIRNEGTFNITVRGKVEAIKS